MDLVISGEDTELDKSVIEEISDPLFIYCVGRSRDRTPEERMKMENLRRGCTSGCIHRAGSIIIEISDDGRGICKEKVLEKAIERGL